MEDLQQKIRQHLEERGWTNGLPGDYAKSVSIEAAELLEHFQWNNYSSQEVKNNPELLQEVCAEVGDVIIYCIELCITLGVDYKEITLAKLAAAQKKYPVELVKNNDKNYYAIHKQYRAKS